MHRKIVGLIVASLLGVFTLPSSLAQDSAALEIEEVVVTATKREREETLQEVPVAVTALNADSLEKAGIKDLRDLDTLATSFNMNSSQTETGGTTLRIRGVGTTGNNIGLESAVGVFLDGVYLSRPGIALADLMDVEQIEVLRGPQGTLFGRNTSAGAISIRTAKPNSVILERYVNLTAGNFGGLNIQAGASGPSSDRTSWRLSAAMRNQDGFLESTTGAESRTRDRYAVRGQLMYDISDTADLRLIFDHADADERCCDAIVLQDSPAVALGSYSAAGLPADGGIQAVGDDALADRMSNSEQFENGSTQTGFSAELNADLSDTTRLIWLSSRRVFESYSVQQSDFVNIDVFEVSAEVGGGFPSVTEITTLTSELRLVGDTDRVSWMVGAYLSNENIDSQGALGLGDDFSANVDAILWNFAFAPVLGAAALFSGVPLATGGTFGDVLAAPSKTIAFAGGVDAAGAFAQNIFMQESRSWSLFTHNTFHLTPELGLLVGMRWVDETKDGSFEQAVAHNQACLNTAANAASLIQASAGSPLEPVGRTIGLFSAGYVCFPFAVPADSIPGRPVTFAETYDDDELAYTVKLSYDFSETLSSYASFTHGFKSGGFNLDATAAIGGADPRFRAEINDAVELGLKTRTMDNRIRTTTAVWQYDLTDFQVLEFTGVQFMTFNVPTAQSQGLEFELDAYLTTDWTMNFGYTHAKSEYPDDCDGNSPDAAASVSSLCGAALTNSPENAVTAGIGYERQLGDRLFFLASNLRWVSERRTSTQPELDFDISDSNHRLNMRAGYGSDDGRWMVEVWSNNITDERVRNLTFSVPLRAGARASFIEAPRTFGMTVRTNF